MAWTTNDEELLILSDDSDLWSEFVLDEQITIDDKSNSSESELISFDPELTGFDISSDSESSDTPLIPSSEEENDFILSFDESDKTENVSLNENAPDLEKSDLDFSLIQEEDSKSSDLNSTLDTKINEKPVLKEENFSLGESDLVENTSSVSLEPVKVENNNLFSSDLPFNDSETSLVWTMTDILDEAIAKFSKREELIVSDINSKEEHIKALKEKIASLESDVNTDNEEVIRLNTEKQSIVKNRKALEKMKEAPVTIK